MRTGYAAGISISPASPGGNRKCPEASYATIGVRRPRAEFLILVEAEGVIHDFIAAWERGERSGTFQAEKFGIDVTKTPIPRFDLLKFDQYLYIDVQYSRGCPFTCEFCDIIELYGRVPRAKTNQQMLTELDRLYELGYRGHVDFVDDNLIGNKKAVKGFLPHLARWNKNHNYRSNSRQKLRSICPMIRS
jgi:radical SAM superfamily enzyme YgiQ (UPF0313 family)